VRHPAIVAVTLLFLVPSVVSAAPAHAAAVLTDARLQQRRSLQVRAQSLRELLQDLTRQSEVRLQPSEEVADEKVTVFTHDEPLSRTLAAVGDLLELRWRRKRVGYELGRDLAITQRDEALCRAKHEAVLHALDGRLRRVDEFLDRSPQELQEEHSRLQAEITRAGTGGAAVLRERLEALDLLQQPLTRPCALLIRRLTPAQRRLLLEGRELQLSSAPSPIAEPLPAGLLPLFQQIPARLPQHLLSSMGKPEERAVDLRLWLEQSSQRASLQCDVTTRGPSTGMSVGQRWYLWSPLKVITAPDGDTGGRRSALFSRPVRLLLKPSSQQFGRLIVETSGRTIADLVEAVAVLTGRNVVADAFTKPDLRAPGETEVVLADYLDVATASVGYRWDAKDGYLRFRDRTYFCDRHGEVPTTDLRRWQKTVGATGTLALDDLADICLRLTDEQLQTLVSAWTGHFGRRWQPRPGPQYLRQHQGEFRWYGLLTPTQRAQLRTGRPLAWQELTPAQRITLQRRLADPHDALSLAARDGRPEQQVDMRPEALARAAFGLRLEQRPVQYLGDEAGRTTEAHIGDADDLLRDEEATARSTPEIELARRTEAIAIFVYRFPTVSGMDLVNEVPVITSLSGSLESHPARSSDRKTAEAR
jgi:hypothetical protein